MCIKLNWNKIKIEMKLILKPGLMQRQDWDVAVSKLSIGLIPTGSGNGLAAMILHTAKESFLPLNAAFVIAKRYNRGMDIYSFTIENNKPKFGFLNFGCFYF